MKPAMERLVLLTLPVPLFLSGFSDAAAVRVDATRACQTIDGFGASSAWTGDLITDDLAMIFWQDDTIDGHIGLSLLRTRIDPNSGYTSAEAGPMEKAKQVNPDVKIWSTSWVPPDWFQTDGLFNSDSASMKGFADHLVKYVQDVKEKTGVDIYAVSCQNEPDADLTEYGCNWTGKQIKTFVRDYWGPAFEKAGITAGRMIGESVRNDLAMSNPSLTDTGAARYVDIVGTHLYYGGPYPYPLADSLGKRYWTTEICGLEDADTSMSNGIMWANKIHDCLVRCNMNAFHYWWLVNKNDNDDEGLCDSKGRPTPRMYTLGNFSKFVRPGFVRVAATDSPATGINVSAFYGSAFKRLVIVAINSGSETDLEVSIPDIPGGSMAVPWLTDSTHRLERGQPIAISGTAFTFTMPSLSVVTFVVREVDIELAVKREPSRPAIRVPRPGGDRTIEVSSSEHPWTMQMFTLSGRRIMNRKIPGGCRGIVMENLRFHGIVLVKISQYGAVSTSPVLLAR